MSLFRRKPERPPAEEREAEVAALRERVARLEADLELLCKENAELAKEASPALRENAVLRYELFKCQTDRQVLEFHLSGLRAELRGTLALLRRLAPGEPPKGEPPLEALLELLEVGRRLGVPVEAFRRPRRPGAPSGRGTGPGRAARGGLPPLPRTSGIRTGSPGPGPGHLGRGGFLSPPSFFLQGKGLGWE